MNDLEGRIRALEAEKQNWQGFKNFFEQQLQKFINVSKPDTHGLHLRVKTQPNSDQLSADRTYTQRTNTSTDSRSNTSQLIRKTQSQRAGINTTSKRQVPTPLPIDEREHLNQQLQKKNLVIEKQREYIKLIDQEVWVFKQSTLLNKDRELEKQNQLIEELQRRIAIKDVVNSDRAQQPSQAPHEMKRQIKALKRELEQKQLVIDKVRGEETDIAKIIQKFEERREQLIELSVMNKQLATKIEKSKEKCNQLQRTLAREQQDKQSLEQQISSQETHIAKLEKQKSKLKQSIGELNSKIQQIQELVRQIDEMREKNQSAQTTISELLSKVSELSKMGDELQYRVSAKSEELQLERNVGQTIKSQQDKTIMMLQHENSELSKQAQRLQLMEKDYMKVKQDHDSIINSNKEFRLKNEQLSEELSKLKQQHRDTSRKHSLNDKHSELEIDNGLQQNYKRMAQMKEKLSHHTKNLEDFSKKFGVHLQKARHHESDDHQVIDEFQNLLLEISAQIDQMNDMQRQIQIDLEKKLQKEIDKQRGLLQQNIQLKLENKKIDELQKLSDKLQHELDEAKKDRARLVLDNKNLEEIAKRGCLATTSLTIPTANRNHRKSLIVTSSVQLPQQVASVRQEKDITQLKKDLMEAHELIHSFQSGEHPSTDKQVNYLNKRIMDLQNQVKLKTAELETQTKEFSTVKEDLEEEIDRLEEEIEARDERLQELLKEKLDQKT